MKKIAILSPDTVPLPLKEDCPKVIRESGQEFDIKDKCYRITALGKRSWRFAEYLSKCKDFEVTLFIPDLNSPGKDFIDQDKIPFNIQTYFYKAANWEWSEELDRKLKNFDFVIIQSTSGTGFLNCAVLPKNVNVILDGWVPFLAELPCVLLTYHRIYRKTNWPKKYLVQYQDLLRRANCILYANDRQYYYYEGQFFMIQKLDWKAFKFSPLLKVPYGIDKPQVVEKKETNPDTLSLLWYGPVYPWYFPEIITKELKDVKNINIDFVGIRHPRYKRIYETYFKKFFDEVKDASNINIIEDYCDNSLELFSKYDAGIILARNWLEEKYSHRCRILEMATNGFPVLLNEGNSLYEELDFLRRILHPVSTNKLLEDVVYLQKNKDKLNFPAGDLDRAYEILKWENVLSPVIDYIRRF